MTVMPQREKGLERPLQDQLFLDSQDNSKSAQVARGYYCMHPGSVLRRWVKKTEMANEMDSEMIESLKKSGLGAWSCVFSSVAVPQRASRL
jgi:hypothetical protein